MSSIVSKNIRLRHPEHFEIGDDSIVDDYCYFSTKVRIGRCSHIASNCTIAGGVAHTFAIGDFSSLSAGVRIWCASDDYSRDIVAVIPAGVEDPKTHVISGDVILANYTAVGANAVIMPDNRIPEGAVIGALSFVPARFGFEPWTVYAGIPVHRVGPRDRDSVLAQVQQLSDALARRRPA